MICRQITNPEDTCHLNSDLENLGKWCSEGQININETRAIRLGTTANPLLCDYILNNPSKKNFRINNKHRKPNHNIHPPISGVELHLHFLVALIKLLTCDYVLFITLGVVQYCHTWLFLYQVIFIYFCSDSYFFV